MTSLIPTERVIPGPSCSATQGKVIWSPVKSLWLFGHILGGLAALVFYPSVGGAVVFLGLSAATLMVGHSVGMHRLLIHRSFQTPLWLERILVWLGTLVGMAGPFGMIRAHDMRDWHQRQVVCPPHPSHGAGWLCDAWWQLHCEFRLTHPPRFVLEPKIANDPFYRWLERYWMAQQIPIMLILYACGGLGWVLWGVSAAHSSQPDWPLGRGPRCP